MGVILAEVNLNLKKIDPARIFKGEKGDYYKVTIALSDELDQYDNNVSAKTSLSKDEREQGIQADFLGNGRVFYVNDVDFPTAQSLKEEHPALDNVGINDDLPF